MRKYLYIILSLSCCIFFSSCSDILEDKGLDICQTEDGYANLEFSMNIPSLNVWSRGTESIESDPYNEEGEWSNWEKFVDGALLYNVTLFVIKEGGTLVGYRDFYYNSENDKGDINTDNGFCDETKKIVDQTATTGTAVKATFSYVDPMHGDIEKLTPGNYTLIAVANYKPITTSSPFYNEDTYDGLGKETDDDTVGNTTTKNSNGDGDFLSIVSTIKSSFNNTKSGLTGFTKDGTNGSEFFNYTLNSGTDRVCKPLPQPLVMIRTATLGSGENTVEGQLSRTFARIRLEVQNNATKTFLDISNLSFAESYASQKAYLFNDVAAGSGINMFDHFALYDGNDDTSLNTKGTLGVTSDDAIVSASSSQQRLLPNALISILDCYILEGKIAEQATFAYSFDATYQTKMADGDVSGNYTIHGFSKDDSAEAGLLDFYLYIRSGTNNETTLLKVDTDNNQIIVADSGIGDEGETSDDNGMTLAPEFIWKIVIPDENTIGQIDNQSQVLYAAGYLKSASTGLYLQPNDGTGTLRLGTKPAVLYFNISFPGQDEKGTILCSYNGSYYYIYIGTDTNNNPTASWVSVTDTSNGLEDYVIPTTTTTAETATAITDVAVTSVLSRKPGGGGFNDTSYDFQILTFETIVAEEVDPITGTITNHIQISNNDGTTTTKREIVRNDFFRGIIPINVTETE